MEQDYKDINELEEINNDPPKLTINIQEMHLMTPFTLNNPIELKDIQTPTLKNNSISASNNFNSANII